MSGSELTVMREIKMHVKVMSEIGVDAEKEDDDPTKGFKLYTGMDGIEFLIDDDVGSLMRLIYIEDDGEVRDSFHELQGNAYILNELGYTITSYSPTWHPEEDGDGEEDTDGGSYEVTQIRGEEVPETKGHLQVVGGTDQIAAKLINDLHKNGC